ncbi:MAG: GIY-YIG nuclease family protein [Saprospiraceae bacterium]|nr:GIY-YIG nuclease family protein [Saprospiraceae bacterium]
MLNIKTFFVMEIYYTYILRSLRDLKNYYGHTKNLDERLAAHNSKKVRSTKARVPFELIYFEEFNTKSEAYHQELFFKSKEGKIYLREKNVI